MSRIPVEFIKSTIEEHKDDHPAPQVVVYLVSYPTKFLFDLLTSFGIVFLAWVFLLVDNTLFITCVINNELIVSPAFGSYALVFAIPKGLINNDVEVLVSPNGSKDLIYD